ncbi:MAG: hypothetical protein ACRDZM_11125, partial [Acidimicrobiia bacterium]
MLVPRAEPSALLADWRHLGVIPRSGRALVIGGQYPDLRSVFEVTAVPSWDEIPESSGSFQLIILCRRLEPRDSIESIERILDPSQGVMVICAPPKRAGTWLHKPFVLQA